MLNVLRDLAESTVARAAFQRDPEAFVEKYDTLSEYEKYLLLERDGSAIEGYLRNPIIEPDGKPGEASMAPTVVNVVALIVVARVPHPEPVVASHFSAFWSRVEDRARALS